MPAPKFTPTEFIATCNQTLDYAFPDVMIEGEVASFKVNQGKWVFFDLKDMESSLNCFMPLYQLRIPLEDGMRVIIKAAPKLTKWGKFSLTVKNILPVGAGSIKKSFELLKKKLADEGLFAPERKRPLPADLTQLGVISSTAAAGYADFIKILDERWGGIKVQVAHTQVQGLDAPDQIMRALKYFNQHTKAQAIAILRGGGSADDLACFNDEQLVRAIAASRIPVVTGIGHEIDESLADLAADLAASTPSNAAQLLSPDRQAEIAKLHSSTSRVDQLLHERINQLLLSNQETTALLKQQIVVKITTLIDQNQATQKILHTLNPDTILQRGYAILSGQTKVGALLDITTKNQLIKAEVKNVQKRP